MKVFSLLLTMAAFAADTRTLFDPTFEFPNAKTFSFVSGTELTKTGILHDPETRDRLKNLIAGFLEPRGLREVPLDEKYDLAVRYWVARKIEKETHLEPDPFAWGGYNPYWTGYWYAPYYEVTEQYAVGTLIIDLMNPLTKQLVWRTFYKDKLEDRVKLYKNINKHLTKAFADLPPSSDKKENMTREIAKLKTKYGESDPVKKP